jgi:hypothetical protein
VEIWYIFPRFGIFNQEKSGNPATAAATQQLTNGLRLFLVANPPTLKLVPFQTLHNVQ